LIICVLRTFAGFEGFDEELFEPRRMKCVRRDGNDFFVAGRVEEECEEEVEPFWMIEVSLVSQF